jgi:hypothetical protein
MRTEKDIPGSKDPTGHLHPRFCRGSGATKSRWIRTLAAPALVGLALWNLAATQSAMADTRQAMTWTALDRQGGYTRVGADASTSPYRGDTAIDELLPLLCRVQDQTAPPDGIDFDSYVGWVQGSVALTSPILGVDLTSQAEGDAICAGAFGAGWRMAEFHDGRYGPGFSYPGGWSYWGGGEIPADTRFWVAINDQPANAWNSEGEVPPLNPTIPNYTKTVLSTGDGWQLVQTDGVIDATQATVSAQLYLTNGDDGLGNLPIPQVLKDDLAADPEPESAFAVDKGIADEIARSIAQGSPTEALIAYGEPEDMGSAAKGAATDGIFGSCSDRDITQSKSFRYVPAYNNSRPIGGTPNRPSGFTGTVSLTANGQIDGRGEVKVSLKRTRIFWVCVPYGVKFRTARVQGSVVLNNGATLSGQVSYSNPRPIVWEIASPILWVEFFMAGPIPVLAVFDLPISAGFDTGDLNASVTGSVTYSGGQNIFGTLDYTCTSSDCTGTSSLQTTSAPGNQPITGSISGRFQPALSAEVAFRGALYHQRFVHGKTGVAALLIGDLWGYYGNNCGADLDGHYDTVGAVTFDLDWQVRVRSTFETFLSKPKHKDLWTSSRSHIGFWDLLGGSASSAMTPMFVGPPSVPAQAMHSYGVKMRPCWPYNDTVNYTLDWGDGSNQALSGPAAAVTVATHTWQNPGNPQLVLTALNDSHGRNFNYKTTTDTVEVTPPQGHPGMTWRLLETNGPYAHVGSDAQTNAYNGDTSAGASLPILCLRQTGLAPPPGIVFDSYNGWSEGDIALSAPVSGFSLTSRGVADNICATSFGAGYRMGEFHDGNGGWTWWGWGDISSGTRFWVAIDDQPANPWN